MYDLIIVGAGPAGITAAVYAARKGMHFLVVADEIGGQMTWSGDIENYTGYQFVTGTDLVAKFEEHMTRYAVPLQEFERVVELRPNGANSGVFIRTEKGNIYEGRTVIIASGKRSRELHVPGELEFRKRGVAYCATCDAPLFAKKNVAVIGGGNSGLEAVLQLMPIAHHVYLVNVTEALTGDAILQEKIEKQENVTILHNTTVQEIYGSKMVEGITVVSGTERQHISVSGVFIEIGLIPNAEFTRLIEKNDWGEIVINNQNQTNVPYIFAAGDVTDVPEKQIIIAAGEGAKALLSAFRYLAHQG